MHGKIFSEDNYLTCNNKITIVRFHLRITECTKTDGISTLLSFCSMKTGSHRGSGIVEY